MPAMSKQQMNDFLRESLVGRIATVDSDGAPYVVPVQYEWDGQHMYIVARKRSEWAKNLLREPRACMLIDEVPSPQRKVVVQGDALVVDADWIAIVRRIVGRFTSAGDAVKFVDGSQEQPRLVFRIAPRKITTWYYPSEYTGKKESWHPRYYEPGTKWYREHQEEQRRRAG